MIVLKHRPSLWERSPRIAARSPAVSSAEPARDAERPTGWLVAVGKVVKTVELGLRALTLGAVLLTAMCMVLLGPYGFFPALLIGPLFALAEAASWVSCRIEARTRHSNRMENPMHGVPEPSQPRRRLRTKTRPARPSRRLDRACEAHRSLPRLLDDLNDPRARQNKLRVAASLEQHLLAHFADEEGSDGLFAEILALKPDLHVEIEARAAEHREILAAVHQVARKLRDSDADAEPCVRSLSAMIRAHQHAEDRLFEQAYGICVGELSSV